MANEKSIGAIWKREGKKGEFFSIILEINGEKLPFIAFKNGFKKEAKQPDYQIFPSQQQGQGNYPTKPVQSSTPAQSATPSYPAQDSGFSDDPADMI